MTLIELLDEYANDLAEVADRLYLSGVHASVAKQRRNGGKLDIDRSVHLMAALPGKRCIDRRSADQGKGVVAGDASSIDDVFQPLPD